MKPCYWRRVENYRAALRSKDPSFPHTSRPLRERTSSALARHAQLMHGIRGKMAL